MLRYIQFVLTFAEIFVDVRNGSGSKVFYSLTLKKINQSDDVLLNKELMKCKNKFN